MLLYRLGLELGAQMSDIRLGDEKQKVWYETLLQEDLNSLVFLLAVDFFYFLLNVTGHVGQQKFHPAQRRLGHRANSKMVKS